MVYLQNIRTEQTAVIPRTQVVPDGGLRLVIRSTADRKELSFSVEDAGLSDLYFIVKVTLPETFSDGTLIPEGSYEYEVSCEGETQTRGTMWIGTIPTVDIESLITKEEYKQYES